MPSVSPRQQCPRGPQNALHTAAVGGSTERTVALLSARTIDIDQANEEGQTPLMLASLFGRSSVARVLLDHGANVSAVSDGGFTALHDSATRGDHAISKMLVKAGADLEAVAAAGGYTPLQVAATRGHAEVMSVLIEAGANLNNRGLHGWTPLCSAANKGHRGAIKMLLQAKADPLLGATEAGQVLLPLDIAARNGHSEVARELVQHVGVEGCGGASGGVIALASAAANQHVDIMTMLTNAGVVDTGMALVQAAAGAREASVKFLLLQRKGGKTAYVNFRESCGFTPLLMATGPAGRYSPSPRIARLLVDAGADTAWSIRLLGSSVDETPLALTTRMLREKKIEGKDATGEQLHKLEGVRRLLLRVEAVHASSWQWPVNLPAVVHTAVKGTRETKVRPPLKRMLPLLRRRARRPRVILAALRRWVVSAQWCDCCRLFFMLGYCSCDPVPLQFNIYCGLDATPCRTVAFGATLLSGRIISSRQASPPLSTCVRGTRVEISTSRYHVSKSNSMCETFPLHCLFSRVFARRLYVFAGIGRSLDRDRIARCEERQFLPLAQPSRCSRINCSGCNRVMVVARADAALVDRVPIVIEIKTPEPSMTPECLQDQFLIFV